MQSFSTFGGNSSSGFKSLGAKTSPLGGKGSQSFGGFGQTANMPTFGQGNTNTGGFGAKPAFGSVSGGLNSRVGMAGFMSKSATSTPTFGAAPTPVFGAAPTFGGANTTSTFGSKPAFGGGASTSGFGGFGQTQNQFQVCPLTRLFSSLFLSATTTASTTKRLWWRVWSIWWRGSGSTTDHWLRLSSIPTLIGECTIPQSADSSLF
jgi:hypothetical protein